MTDPEILVVEDNRELARGLRTNMRHEGYRVTLASTGTEALEAVRGRAPDLMVLDLMLPGMDGFQVLRELRKQGRRFPVLVLSARGEEADKVLGFRVGADDYVTKPFGLMELMARVAALLRRSRIPGVLEEPQAMAGPAPTIEGPFRFGSVVLDPGARTATRAGTEVPLSPKEFDLLLALIRRRGVVATRAELLREVWNHRAPVASRTVDTHMGQLRRKLEEEPSKPRHLITVRKVGYRFQE